MVNLKVFVSDHLKICNGNKFQSLMIVGQWEGWHVCNILDSVEPVMLALTSNVDSQCVMEY